MIMPTTSRQINKTMQHVISMAKEFHNSADAKPMQKYFVVCHQELAGKINGIENHCKMIAEVSIDEKIDDPKIFYVYMSE